MVSVTKHRLVSLTRTAAAAMGLAVALTGSALAQGTIAPPEATDMDPAPNVLEVTLTAQEAVFNFGNNNNVKVYTFNGMIPGPLLKAEVGDRLIVHFYNNLNEDSSIHWHGVDVPATMDGSHIAQLPVPPGGYFKYDFILPEAGLFWYHPHFRTNVQVEKGLYGPLLVTDSAEDAALGLPTNHHVLVLDDILLDAAGQVEAEWPTDALDNAQYQLNGREGNVLLMNGSDLGTTPVLFNEGEPTRLHIVNVSNSRFMRVSIKDHMAWRIGGDHGLIEAPLPVPPIGPVPNPQFPNQDISDQDLDKGVILTPGERADLVFEPKAGNVEIEWHDVARGRHSTFFMMGGMIMMGHIANDGQLPSQTLLTVGVNAGAPSGYTPPATLATLTPIDTTGAKMVMSMFGHAMPDMMGNVMFFAQMKNGMGLPFMKVTPADAPTLNNGDVAIWEVHNMTGGMHNFHLHGFSFQLLETEFIDMDTPGNNFKVYPTYLEDKDTIILPARPGTPMMRSRSITRVALKIDDTGRVGQIEAYGKVPTGTTSGGWLFHCHIMEHAAKGMMSFLQVMDP